MNQRKDNYTQQERKDYNRHYYPTNKQRIAEQRHSPIAVRRRKINRIRRKYEAKISELLEMLAAELSDVG